MKLAVILHLYYIDLWKWFVPYLDKIKSTEIDFDLYVTLCVETYNFELIERIRTYHKPINIHIHKNKGMDIAPFLFVLKQIETSNKIYDCILKLHGKKSLIHSKTLGNTWRTTLVESLLKSPKAFIEYFYKCRDTGKKMIASQAWNLLHISTGYEQKYFKESIPNDYRYRFIGGTIFLINFDLLMNWFIENDIYNRFYHDIPEGYTADGSISHELERVFGCIVKIKGYEILGV